MTPLWWASMAVLSALAVGLVLLIARLERRGGRR